MPMCGRVTLELDLQLLKEILQGSYQVKQMTLENHTPRYNIAPTQQMLSIVNDGKINRAGFLSWGLVPPNSKDITNATKLINARSETIDVKPSFRTSFINKRCLLLVSSFYEWHRTTPDKTPYRIIMKDQPLMPMAGIWSKYTKNDGSTLFTCSVITTEANSLIKNIHNRMPVILEPNAINIWLNSTLTNPKDLKTLLKPCDASLLKMTPVSKLVNNARIDSPECSQPL
jgi:putative SOS response-associated peptidase YedK